MGWSGRSSPLQNWLQSFTSSAEYPLHFTVRSAAGQSLAATQAAYAFTVTSVLSMQYPDSLTSCCGCSSVSPAPSGLPIRNVPAGTCTIPAGQCPDEGRPSCGAGGVGGTAGSSVTWNAR